MLTFLLLPFLLVVRVSNNVGYWQNGPEYTYLVQVNMLAEDEDGTAGRRAYDIFTNLKCRPREPDILRCQFEQTRDDYSGTKESVSEFDISELPFEVVFNRFDIYQLLVDKNLRPWEIDMIRAIINQFNFGYDVREVPRPHETREISYLGESRAIVGVQRKKTEEQNQLTEVDFQITPMSRENFGEVIDIEKIRIIEKSPLMASYFFGSKEAHRVRPQHVVATMKSSVSRIIIADTNFTSYTANEIHVRRDKNKNVTLHERITLSLQSVTPAKTELQPIHNAVLADFSIHKYIEDESSEEN